MRADWWSVLRSAAVAAIALGVPIALPGVACGQPPVFEVSPVTPGRRAVAAGVSGYNIPPRIARTPQRIAFQSSLVGDIVAFAYGFPLDRVERRPQWMYDDRYNVAVTTEAPASVPEQKLLLQQLLEERFGLVVHRVSYESTVYYLVSGPNVHLTPTQEAGTPELPEFRGGVQYDAAGQPISVFYARHVSMGDLADWLYPHLQLPIFDNTGMTGFFDLEITTPRGRGGAEAYIQAVKNSLGLDLERHHGTAESLIIDRAEKPGAN